MLQLLDEFKDIIKSVTIEKYDVSGDNIKLRIKLLLVTNSWLFVRETIISGEKRKYSYHWQDEAGNLIKRWDNAPDWDVETFPHHLHIGEKKRLQHHMIGVLKKSLQLSGKKSVMVSLTLMAMREFLVVSPPCTKTCESLNPFGKF